MIGTSNHGSLCRRGKNQPVSTKRDHENRSLGIGLTALNCLFSEGFVCRLLGQSYAQNKEKRDQEDDNYHSDRKNPLSDGMPRHVLIIQLASVPPLAPVDEPGVGRTLIAGINVLSAVFTAASLHTPSQHGHKVDDCDLPVLVGQNRDKN